MIEVPGSPIGGENPPHDARWRAMVAAAATGAAAAAAIELHFRLEPHRRWIWTTSPGPRWQGCAMPASVTGGTADSMSSSRRRAPVTVPASQLGWSRPMACSRTGSQDP